MKLTHDSLLLRVSCLRTHQTVFKYLNTLYEYFIFKYLNTLYELALHLCVLSTILIVLATLLLLYIYIYIYIYIYLTIIRRRQGEYCRIIPETKSRGYKHQEFRASGF